MSRKRFTEEFKIEAVRQITERGFAVRDVGERLGVSPHSLYTWIKQYGIPAEKRVQQQDQSAEVKRLQAQLKRVTEERDILKNAAVSSIDQSVMVHSDQGSQLSSYEWQGFLKEHNLVASMSRRGNCHDNAVVESFFQLLKRERIKRRTCLNREQARQDVFDYIEMFYNPIRRHSHNDGLSPVKYEQQFNQRLASV